ncbi:CpsD/CapB family tyrosine-protein kinase [Enterococcus faecalis]|uniref:CpsD/CapB family tyrosine-protein kinase n=1 Tax=Enterococcus faecalis TaxID=1351 RepID=UPI0020913DDB|nr:CpsD/CapB family tyrosine-protein kinase [Enterococcus faecalis]MCO5432264.1 CpsD/CapB family tyrosine-protein kinase [Enterococcus faecalis]
MKKEIPIDVVNLFDQDSPYFEQYRILRTNIDFQRKRMDIKTILVASANSGDGKTTTTLNLGAVFAANGNKVLIIDGDLRKRSLSQQFGYHKMNGGFSLLLENSQVDSSTCIKSTNNENLFFLPAGNYLNNPAELFTEERVSELFREFSESFDLVLIDIPPLLEVADGQILATKVDSTVLVVRESKTSRESVVKAKKTLDSVDAPILGVVRNAAKSSNKQYYGMNKKYGENPTGILKKLF